ncbi:hypothetical protein L9F63_020397, partial [Diploptera punctata]
DKKMVDTPRLITGTNWTSILITWAAGYITISEEGGDSPFLAEEYNETSGLLGIDPGAFHYYSIMGEGGLWSFPFCDIDCEMHTTSHLKFIRFWPMTKTTTTHDAMIFVRAMHAACLEFRISPAIKYPNIRVMMGGRKNLTKVILHRRVNTKEILIKQVKIDNLLSYWEWREFTI